MRQKQKGFTLIELLLVVSTIGLLSSIIFVSLSNARRNARDVKRLTDIRAIQTALSLYYQDNGRFPVSGYAGQPITPDDSWTNSNNVTSWNNLYTMLQPYITRLPHDPTETSTGWPGDSSGYSYSYYSQSYGCSTDWHMLVYRLEIPKGPDPGAYACSNSWQYGGSGANTAVKTIVFVK